MLGDRAFSEERGGREGEHGRPSDAKLVPCWLASLIGLYWSFKKSSISLHEHTTLKDHGKNGEGLQNIAHFCKKKPAVKIFSSFVLFEKKPLAILTLGR